MNMIQNIKKQTAIAIVLFLTLIALLPLKAHAADVLWDSYDIPATRQKERLLDNADLLTDSQEKELLSTLNSLSEKWKCNIVLLTVNSHNGPIQDYSDDYFDYNGFGADYNNSGILFMLSMEDREWAISTCGSAIQAFTDYGQEYLVNNMMPYLRNGDYSGAFNQYATTCDYLLSLYSKGTPYDVGYKPPKTTEEILQYLLISILIGLVTALFPILGMKSQLKTVKTATNAFNYQSTLGLKLKVKSDNYIRTTVSKVPIPKNDGNSGGGGGRSSSFGGSSTHVSSSGTTHGGSHGHF